LKARFLSVFSTLSSLPRIPSTLMRIAGDSPLMLEVDLSLALNAANLFLTEIPGGILAFGRPSCRTADRVNGFPAIFRTNPNKHCKKFTNKGRFYI
ncbi:MAG: hypothetical protein ACK559_26505, partial [bacterium]